MHGLGKLEIDRDGHVIEMLGTIQDITEQKLTELALRTSLEEKEALLKEVHHRVKNNLQIVTSLLSLQARREEQESAKAALRDMQSRVRAMALLHEALYRSPSLAQVDFGPYVQNLCEQLARSYQRNAQPIHLQVDVADLKLDLERAVPCGLIISELVTNACKHAFPDGRAPEVRVTSRNLDAGEVEFGVADNGVGFPAAFEIGQGNSLGLQLVTRLSAQLGGHWRVQKSAGADIRIRLPIRGTDASAPPIDRPTANTSQR